MPILPQNLIDKADKYLRKMKVEIITGTKISGVTPNSVILGEDNEIKSSTVIWTAGVEGSDLVGNLDVQQQGRKRILTNDKLQSVDYDNVYVVGDNIFYIPEGEERPVPQMVENAEHSAGLIAHNLVCDIKGGTQNRISLPSTAQWSPLADAMGLPPSERRRSCSISPASWLCSSSI